MLPSNHLRQPYPRHNDEGDVNWSTGMQSHCDYSLHCIESRKSQLCSYTSYKLPAVITNYPLTSI
jgi:hypothetical protein